MLVMGELIHISFKHRIVFDDDYPMFIDGYPKHKGWMMAGGWKNKGIMRGSILGMEMTGFIKNGTKAGYKSMIAVKLANMCRDKVLSGNLVKIPCKTNIFDNCHNATNRRMEEIIKHAIIKDVSNEKKRELCGKIFCGYIDAEKTYFFLVADSDEKLNIIDKLDRNGGITMSSHRSGILF